MHRVVPTLCPSCEQAWQHCHGVVLVHLDGSDECTAGDACPGAALPHEWREPCWAAVGSCCGQAFGDERAGAPAAA